MRKKRTPSELVPTETDVDPYNAVLADVTDLLESARRGSARSVNSIMATTDWAIGRRIVESEQERKDRAADGTRLVARLAVDLTKRFGRGFGAVNLAQMRKFYQTWPASNIFQTPSEKLRRRDKSPLQPRFPLSWSHYVRLLSVEKPGARAFYCAEHRAGVAKYVLEGLPTKILAARYRTALPTEETLAAELEGTRKMLDGQPGRQQESPRETDD
jgi:DUF1016 N-terminal domain